MRVLMMPEEELGVGVVSRIRAPKGAFGIVDAMYSMHWFMSVWRNGGDSHIAIHARATEKLGDLVMQSASYIEVPTDIDKADEQHQSADVGNVNLLGNLLGRSSTSYSKLDFKAIVIAVRPALQSDRVDSTGDLEPNEDQSHE